jgi:cobalamin biosynthesis protein CobT
MSRRTAVAASTTSSSEEESEEEEEEEDEFEEESEEEEESEGGDEQGSTEEDEAAEEEGAGSADEGYEVEAIVESRRSRKLGGQFAFLVKWQGYDETTWEPETACGGCAALIAAYRAGVAKDGAAAGDAAFAFAAAAAQRR